MALPTTSSWDVIPERFTPPACFVGCPPKVPIMFLRVCDGAKPLGSGLRLLLDSFFCFGFGFFLCVSFMSHFRRLRGSKGAGRIFFFRRGCGDFLGFVLRVRRNSRLRLQRLRLGFALVRGLHELVLSPANIGDCGRLRNVWIGRKRVLRAVILRNLSAGLFARWRDRPARNSNSVWGFMASVSSFYLGGLRDLRCQRLRDHAHPVRHQRIFAHSPARFSPILVKCRNASA